MKLIHFSKIFLYLLIFLFQSYAQKGNDLPDKNQFELNWKENGLPYIRITQFINKTKSNEQ
jgi:hypothetical protein